MEVVVAADDESGRLDPVKALLPELVTRVYSDLHPEQRVRSREVSRAWRDFVDRSPLIWKHLCLTSITARKQPSLLRRYLALAQGCCERLDISGWVDIEKALQCASIPRSSCLVGLRGPACAMAQTMDAADVGSALAEAVATGLEHLIVTDCGLGEHGLKPLFAAVAASTRIHTLICDGYQSMDAECAHFILHAVQQNRSLRCFKSKPTFPELVDAMACVSARH